jgi:transcription elongation factor GreA
MTKKPITPEGHRALREEIERLETVGRREIADRIKTAREWGDLKENAEYHDAKNDQALMETKIIRLNQALREAVVEEPVAAGVAGFGSTIELVNVANEKTNTYTLVGSTEADAAAGRLSAESPVGKALLGASAGDTVTVQTPAGKQQFKVLSLS